MQLVTTAEATQSLLDRTREDLESAKARHALTVQELKKQLTDATATISHKDGEIKAVHDKLQATKVAMEKASVDALTYADQVAVEKLAIKAQHDEQKAQATAYKNELDIAMRGLRDDLTKARDQAENSQHQLDKLRPKLQVAKDRIAEVEAKHAGTRIFSDCAGGKLLG